LDAGVYITGVEGGMSAAVLAERQVVVLVDMPTCGHRVFDGNGITG
jgi:hypothetical protein